jgi:hypothetical protein
VRDWKSRGRVKPPRGFESHPLRYRSPGAKFGPSCRYHLVRGQVRTVEEIAERFASNARGVVKREWLLGSGVTARQVEHRTKTGYLFAEFRGVYRVGHRAPSVEATYMAAVLACGDDAALGGLRQRICLGW